MASRRQSIRTKIITLLVVPLVSLLALWGFAAYITLGDAQRLLSLQTLDVKLVRPTDDVLVALKNERRMSVAFLGNDSSVDRSGFDAQRLRTDAARRAFLANYRDPGLRNDVIERETARRLDAFAQNLDEIGSVRKLVDARAITRDRALTAYTDLLDGAYAIYASVTLPDAELAGEAKTYIMLNRAQEILNREDALLTGALAAGRITTAEHAQFARLVSTQRALNQDAVPGLPDPARIRLEKFFQSKEFTRFQSMEDRVLRNPPSSGPRLPIDAGSWHTITETAAAKLSETERLGYDEMTVRANEIAQRVIVQLALAGGLGLIAVITSVVVATRASRRIIQENRALAAAVAEFGQERMPAIVERVQKTENFDPDEGAPDLEFTLSEVDKVYRRFVEARRAVVEATVREVAVRKGVSEVFVNLARRNQTLLHRQLNLLDKMERRVEDPDELEDLFRLDHLATRMRRHAEGLVILSGKSAGRNWRNPVPIVDVARGAVAEVEDYTRVRVLPMTRAALTGAAVADTIHLLAELIENATLYSPPELPVQVSGQVVANGFALEVEDRGLGLTPEVLAEANKHLAKPREFDPGESTQLGLFVVARLARRHDIKVSLRMSPYGGTTAIVLIPAALMVDLPEDSGPQPLEFTPAPDMRPVPENGLGAEPRSMSGSWAATMPGWGEPFTPGASNGGPVPVSGNGTAGTYGPRYDEIEAVPDSGLTPAVHGLVAPAEQSPAGPGPVPVPEPDGDGRPGAYDIGPQDAAPLDTAVHETAVDDSAVDGSGDAGPVTVDDRPPGLPEGLPHRRRQIGRWRGRGAPAGGDRPRTSANGDRTRTPASGSEPHVMDEPEVSARPAGPAAPAAPAAKVEAVPPAGRPEPAGSAADQPSGPNGLPRRRRQASLAPQLRDDPRGGTFGGDRVRGGGAGPRTDASPDPWETTDDAGTERPPEAVRTMMAAMQQGWKRGRADSEQAEVAAGQPVRSGTEEDV